MLQEIDETLNYTKDIKLWEYIVSIVKQMT